MDRGDSVHLSTCADPVMLSRVFSGAKSSERSARFVDRAALTRRAGRLLPLLVLLTIGCPPAATLPRGCGKDNDCKGARICVAHACVDPPAMVPAAAGKVPAVASDGGAVDAVSPPLPPLPRLEALPTVGVSAMFHVDASHTGRSRFVAPTKPREVGHVATGGVVVSSPAITDRGVLIFGSHDRSVYAVDAAGKILWRHPTGDLVWGSPALGHDGAVYVGSDDDHLYALDLADGHPRWTFTAGPCRAGGVGPESARCDVDGVSVGPDGTVFASADGLYALSPAGAVLWKFSPGVTHCAGNPAVGPDGVAYVGCQDDAIYAVGPDGQKRWDFRTGGDVDGSPALGSDGTLYIGSDDRKLYALGPGGALKWAVTTGGPVRSSPAIGPDGTIYVGSFDGVLYAVRPNGTVSWTFRSADRIVSSPLVDRDGNVIFGSEDDRLYALSADGKLAWSVLFDGDVDATPALGPDGTLYVGCDDRALHLLR